MDVMDERKQPQPTYGHRCGERSRNIRKKSMESPRGQEEIARAADAIGDGVGLWLAQPPA